MRITYNLSFPTGLTKIITEVDYKKVQVTNINKLQCDITTIL